MELIDFLFIILVGFSCGWMAGRMHTWTANPHWDLDKRRALLHSYAEALDMKLYYVGKTKPTHLKKAEDEETS